MSVREINRRFMLLGKYVQYLLSSTSLNDIEKETMHNIMVRFNQGDRCFFDITSMNHNNELIAKFSNYCDNLEQKSLLFSPKLFMFISPEYHYYLSAILELEKRNIDKIYSVWDYNWIKICQMKGDDYFISISDILNKWISNLPLLYQETYDNLFSCDNYKIKQRYEFNIIQNWVSSYLSDVSHICHIYSDKEFIISYDKTIEEPMSLLDSKVENVFRISQGLCLGNIFEKNMPFFYSISCLLYEGICKELGFNNKGLNIGNIPYSRHLSFF